MLVPTKFGQPHASIDRRHLCGKVSEIYTSAVETYFYVKLLDTHLVFYSFIGYQEPQAQTTETTAHASCNARSRDAHCRRCQTAHTACAQLKGCILYCVEKRVE